jgi:ribonucleoside-diphosphate reductase subunit M1
MNISSLLTSSVVLTQFQLNLGGRQEDVHFDKITSRIQKLCYGLNSDFVDPVCIVSCKILT